MRADIFCRVIDNFGDIGVCWRLARRMSTGFQWKVRLWVDNLDAFSRIQPTVSAHAASQCVQDIEIIHWDEVPADLTPGDVVIEAFACDPPAAFVHAMTERLQPPLTSPPIWINLEYLSAESWVEGCHLLSSLRADGLTKYFFFPGFTANTGGLLREPALTVERDEMQHSTEMQTAFLHRLGVSESALDLWRTGARLVSLFCYPYAPVAALAHAFVHSDRPTVLLVPKGVAPTLEAEVARWRQSNPATNTATQDVSIARIPFVSQPDFDRVLWCADLNFVRGEDSFVRAAWAARPLVWQIYAQEDNAHLEKLESWLARYPIPADAQAVIRAWNQVPNAPADLPAATPTFDQLLTRALSPEVWPTWQDGAKIWDETYAVSADLGDRLAEFCANLLKKR